MKTKIILFSLALAFASCKKDSEVGPQGPAGPAGPAFSFSSGGYIEGAVSGTRSDGTPFNSTFNYQHYYQPDYFSFDAFSGYQFEVHRYPSSNPSVSGSTYFDFDITSLTSGNIDYASFSLSLFKELGNNQVFAFNCFASGSSIIVTNFSYDINTHIAQGNFAINASNTSSGWPATIIGSFKTIACKEYLFRRD